MKFVNLLIVLLCLFVASFSLAQDGTISGIVSDEFGPLAGARLEVKGTNLTGSSDINGFYSFEVKPGQHIVQASYLLFGTQEKNTEIDFNNLNVKVNFKLISGSVIDIDTEVGSRDKPKSQMENAVAVDVISSADIENSGQFSLTGLLHFMVPSFYSVSQTISDGTDHIDPIALRGLGPDQVLVLVNGKRRHASSLINVNGTEGKGTAGVDLNAIPLTAVDRIEILRDGAAAQYGSDAIAGVINIILKERINVFSVNSVVQPTLQHDGMESVMGVNYGVGIGKGGFLNVSAELRKKDAVNRAGDYTGNVYDQNDSIDAILIEENQFFEKLSDYDGKQIMQIGSAKISNGGVFFNSVIPLNNNNAEIYSNGGANFRRGEARGFYRLPHQTNKVVLELYPDGFSPQIHTEIEDKFMTIGVRGERKGWNIDMSNSVGQNSLGFNVKNSNNASLGIASPTSSYAGGFMYYQNTSLMSLTKNFESVGFLKNIFTAFGGEYKLERYEIISGESSSWIDGGEVNSSNESYAVGFQVFPGFQPQNALVKRRSSFAAFADVEYHFTENFYLETAMRFENYDFFGENLTWKLASRYKMSDNISLRGSYSTGFRAPSMHQIYFNNLGTQFIDGVALQVGTFNNESTIAKALGIESLQPETSNNFSGGFSARLLDKFTISGDAYFIGIENRIVLSGRISSGYEDILENVGAGSAQFFTNAINTQTVGFDIVPTFNTRIVGGLLKVSAGFNNTITKLVGNIETSEILDGAEDQLFNREEISRIVASQPANKAILIINYARNKLNVILKGTRFGSVKYVHPNDGDEANWTMNEYSGKVETRDQEFSPKILTDLAITYKFNNYFKLTAGGNNIFNVYPDKHTHSGNTSQGNFIYSRRVQQFGVLGTSFYIRLNLSF